MHNRIYNIFRYGIVVLCLALVVYKLLSIDNWQEIKDSLRMANDYWLLCLAFLLLAINVFMESLKWKLSLENILPQTFQTSFKSVMWGYTGAFISPNSIGEYPTRVMLLPEGSRTKAVSMGFFCGVLQTFVVLAFGLFALVFGQFPMGFEIRIVVLIALPIVVLFLLLVCYVRYLGKFIGALSARGVFQKISLSLVSTYTKQIVLLLVASIMKYIAYSTQFFIVLRFCGVDMSLTEGLIAMPIFYLCLTLIPLVNIFDVAVRSTVGFWIFSPYTSNSFSIVVASTIFWLMNFCFLSLVGLFFGRKK